jgi:hypothetical protein
MALASSAICPLRIERPTQPRLALSARQTAAMCHSNLSGLIWGVWQVAIMTV